MMRILIKYGSDVNAEDADGRTPLSWAAQQAPEPQIHFFYITNVRANTLVLLICVWVLNLKAEMTARMTAELAIAMTGKRRKIGGGGSSLYGERQIIQRQRLLCLSAMAHA
jgi:hypothetical protein